MVDPRPRAGMMNQGTPWAGPGSQWAMVGSSPPESSWGTPLPQGGTLEARTSRGILEVLCLGGARKALNWTEPAETKASWAGPAGADSASSWDGAGAGADSVSSWDGAGAGADSAAPGTERALERTLRAPGTERALERTLRAPGTERALERTLRAPGTERALERIYRNQYIRIISESDIRIKQLIFRFIILLSYRSCLPEKLSPLK